LRPLRRSHLASQQTVARHLKHRDPHTFLCGVCDRVSVCTPSCVTQEVSVFKVTCTHKLHVTLNTETLFMSTTSPTHSVSLRKGLLVWHLKHRDPLCVLGGGTQRCHTSVWHLKHRDPHTLLNTEEGTQRPDHELNTSFKYHPLRRSQVRLRERDGIFRGCRVWRGGFYVKILYEKSPMSNDKNSISYQNIYMLYDMKRALCQTTRTQYHTKTSICYMI